MQPTKPTSNAPNITPQQAQQAARALSSTLAHPYSDYNSIQQHNYYAQSFHYSSHYSNAYQLASSTSPMTTPDGYSLSSTYTPTTHVDPQYVRGRGGLAQRGRGGQHRGGFTGSGSHGNWYQPGNHSCSHGNCTFMGSKKSVEIHMMDRHLIYPPGWENQKRKPEWDADPSLNNGKPIPILGTNVILQTSEEIDAWIAERKKRWPTNARKEEKEKKLREAVDRGEITAVDALMRGKKRQRRDDSQQKRRGREKSQLRGRGYHISGHRQFVAIDTSLPKKPPAPIAGSAIKQEPDTDSESSSGSDMDPGRDAVPSKPIQMDAKDVRMADVESGIEITTVSRQQEKASQTASQLRTIARRTAPKPRPAPRNPFSNRQSLLRNLLLPEIRVTISNLSQAVHFLVENNFLDNVELNPGDVDNEFIQIINATDAITDV